MISSPNTVPEGVVFHPSDKMLLSHYLQTMNQGKGSQITIIPVIDVSKHEPRDLPALVLRRVGSGDRVWLSMADSWDMQRHFFRPRNSCKTTQEGSWRKQGNDRRIKAPGAKDEIGGKRILVFYLHDLDGKPTIRTDWVIHEYFLTEEHKQIGKFVLCRLRNKSDEQDEGEPSSGSCSMISSVENQAVAKGMTTEAEENQLASKELGHVSNGSDEPCSGGYHITPSALEIQAASNVLVTEAEEFLTFMKLADALQIPNGNEDYASNGWQTGSCLIDENELSNCVEGQPDSCNPSDSDMIAELLDDHEPENQPQPPHQSHPPQDYRPSILQSPIYEQPGNVSRATIVHDDECRKRNCPFGDNDPSLTKKNNISTKDYDELVNNTSSNSENQAPHGIPEGHSQPGANLGLGFDSFQPLDYDFALPSIYGGPGDFFDYNDFIGLDDLPSSFEDIGSSLAKSSDTIIDGGSGVSSDRNTEVVHCSVKDYSALAIGAEQRSNVNELP